MRFSWVESPSAFLMRCFTVQMPSVVYHGPHDSVTETNPVWNVLQPRPVFDTIQPSSGIGWPLESSARYASFSSLKRPRFRTNANSDCSVQYHAVPGNTSQLRVFRRRVCRLWRSVLVRRSQRAQVGWDRLNPLLNRWIPHPHVLHPYPDKRFDAIHPLYA
jgi:hypothetical protein